jgi:hypothetical protein
MSSADQLNASRRSAIEVDEVGQPAVGQFDRPKGDRIKFENNQVSKPVVEVSEL